MTPRGQPMRIDAHQHFWRYNPTEYDWIGDEMAVLKKNHLPADLQPLLAEAGIAGTIAVQARQTLEETAWLLSLADGFPFIKGVVGWVDLRSRDVEEQLARFAGHPRLVGVRHVVHDEPDDRFMLRTDFLRGLEVVGRFDLAYDILIFPRHLPVVCEVARRFPNQRFVLDHMAKPFIREGLMEPWRTDLQRLAAFPNVWCKVSGLVTEAHWRTWRPFDLRPYLDAVFETFGAGRIMAGSDWPVCTVAATYSQVLGVVTDYAAALPEDEQSDLLGGNAQACYRLPEAK